MSFVPFSQGQPNIASTSAIADATGTTIFCDGISVLTYTFTLAVGAGTVTGTVYFEATSQQTGTISDWGRLLIPAGALHTSLSGVALSTPVSATMGSTTVALTAVTSGTFIVTLSDLPVGNVRAVYDWASGSGASPNTLVAYAAGKGI